MEHITGKMLMKFEKEIYAIFRIAIGFLFFSHGAQKLFAWFGGSGPVPMGSLFWWAGVIEVVVGIMFIVGGCLFASLRS